MKLLGKTAIITGSSRGIGRQMALAFAKEGASVVVNYLRSKEEANEVVRGIESMGAKAIAVQADVSRAQDVNRLMEEALRSFGRVDILVNNAGHSSREVWFAKLEEISEEMWDIVMGVDLKGTFNCSKAAAPIMKKQGRGKIINIASTPALTGDVMGLVYSVAKAGVLGLTRSLARILAPEVQVNALVLGSIETGWVNWLTPAQVRELVEAIPLKRLGRPEDVARVAVFLASEDSEFVTGQAIVVDGGEYMH